MPNNFENEKPERHIPAYGNRFVEAFATNLLPAFSTAPSAEPSAPKPTAHQEMIDILSNKALDWPPKPRILRQRGIVEIPITTTATNAMMSEHNSPATAFLDSPSVLNRARTSVGTRE